MTKTVEFKIENMAEFKQVLEKLGGAAAGKNLRDAVEAGMRVIEGNAIANIEKNFSSRSQGNLAGNRSLETVIEGAQAVAKLIFHSVHARIQEFGGVIKPVSAKYLAIPHTDSARKAGSPRNYPEKLRFAGSDSGGVLTDASGEVVYVLKKAVTLPARPYLRPAMDEHVSEIEQAMAASLRQSFEEATRGNR